MRFYRGQRFEFGKKFTLPLGEILRCFHLHLDIKIACFARSQYRHTFAFQFELFAGLRSFRDFDLGFAAAKRVHRHFGTERRLDQRDGDAAEEIGAFALKKGMRLGRHENIKIAGRAALCSGLAFAAKPDPRSVLDTWRNIDGKAALPGDAARTAAGLAWVVNDFAAPMAMRTGPLYRKKALLRAHPPVSAAGRAMPWFRARFGSGTRTRLAAGQGWQNNRRRLAVKCLFECNFHIVAEIRPARGTPASAAAPSSHHIAEEIVENIGHRRGEPIASSSETALLEGSVTIAIEQGGF